MAPQGRPRRCWAAWATAASQYQQHRDIGRRAATATLTARQPVVKVWRRTETSEAPRRPPQRGCRAGDPACCFGNSSSPAPTYCYVKPGAEVLVTWRAMPKSILGPWTVDYYPGEEVVSIDQAERRREYASTWWNAKGDDVKAPDTRDLPLTPASLW